MWLRAARELRTIILMGWKSYELEAAVLSAEALA
jgi:hypothetical protein